MFARTLNRDLEIVRDVRDISYQRTIVFDQRRLFDLPAQEGVAGHHLFDDDLTVLALAGFRARCACCAPCASLHCRHSHTPPSISPFPARTVMRAPNLSQGYPNTRPNSNACSMACQAGKLNQSMQNSGPSVDRNARAGPQDTRGVRLSLPFPQRGWLTMKYTRF